MPSSRSTTSMQGTPFGQWLRERRNALGLTREELAARVGCSAETIYKLEAGTRRPSRQVAEIVATFFNLPNDEKEAFIGFARGQGLEQKAVGSRRKAEDDHSAPRTPHPALGEHPWRAAKRRLTNLPAQMTSLIGREGDIEQVRALVTKESVRLLTLVGPAGIGKTRLAIEAGTQLLERFADGVFFVPLAPITDGNLAAAAIAKALDVQEATNRPLLDTLAHYLRDKRVLLVLDNFEQILEAGPQIGELLAECPWLKTLVTSREALHLYGERQYPVPALQVPSSRFQVPGYDDQPGTWNLELGTVSSVALFVERAQAVRPDFALTEENAGAVARVCAHLGGVPLAIELAAVRVRLFSPQAMLPRLEQSLQLLTGGARDLPTRHQTLRDAIGWSYNLLDGEEQKLFKRLGAFVGGCDLVAVEAVCNASGDVQRGVASGLESLIDKSLVQVENGEWRMENAERPILRSPLSILHSQEARFSMLETIREYALERLEETEEVGEVRQLHAEYCLALAEAAQLRTAGDKTGVWLQRLEREHDNFRAALTWAEKNGRAEFELRLATALAWFWIMRGHFNEGRKRLVAALARAEVLGSTEARATALNMAGRITAWQGLYSQARSYYGESLAIYSTLPATVENGARVASALIGMGIIARFCGEYDDAVRLYEESLGLYRAASDKEGIASSLWQMAAVAARLGDGERARRLGGESLALYEQLGDAFGASASLQMLGYGSYIEEDYTTASSWAERSLAAAYEVGDRFRVMLLLKLLSAIEHLRGNYPRARTLSEESWLLGQQCGDGLHAARMLCSLGYIELRERNPERAGQLFTDSLRVCSVQGEKADLASCLTGLGGVAGALGRPRRAATLLGATDAIHADMEQSPWPMERIEYERNVATVRTQLPEAEWLTAWAEGQAMSEEETVAFALDSF